ncbi:L-seryl-tRNA(Sec) kinase-like [Oppia nitens]|uniref:L-seryl-tRNA(Sec) kinase-like n=1 Tax=Oppia nitens TaxID=1686743 RepID=UPI0023DC5EBC|nr:L-seryl-tRNA(Sec) kinase-like [Oppia nitens]
MGYKYSYTQKIIREEIINTPRIQEKIKQFFLNKNEIIKTIVTNDGTPVFVWLDECCCDKNIVPKKTLVTIDPNKREKTNKSCGKGPRFSVIHAGNEDGFINGALDIVFIDDNLYYKSMRYEWYQTCKELSLGFAIIMINTSLELSLNGNRLRDEDKRLPDDVIVRMSERFECPQPSAEPFEQKTYFLSADTTIDHKIDDSLIEFITDAIGEPVVDQTIRSPIEEQLRERLNTESKNNVIHKIDCLLRQNVGQRSGQIISTFCILY